MNVFKFGGASIETVDRAKNVADIIQDFANDKLLVVISAKGKTTNALEKLCMPILKIILNWHNHS